MLKMIGADISYDGETAVWDFNLEVFPGEIVGIAGESGSGKSTVIRAASGLLGREGALDRGEIWFQGEKISGLSQERLRSLRGNQIGMIFQNTGASLCPIRRIQDQFQEMLKEHGHKNRKENKAAVLELLGKLNFPDGERILRSYPFELSGGMNQRVGIALAMILRPKILLADEPTSALDVTVQAQVMRELMKMRELYGTGIVIVAHNIGLLYHMTDRLLVMKNGRIVEEGPTKEVIASPQNEYTQKLIRSVPRLRRKEA